MTNLGNRCPVLDMGSEHFDAEFHPHYEELNVTYPEYRASWIPGFSRIGWDACRENLCDASGWGSLLAIPCATQAEQYAVTEVLSKPFISHDVTVNELLAVTPFFIGAGHDGYYNVGYYNSQAGLDRIEALTQKVVDEIVARPAFEPFTNPDRIYWDSDGAVCWCLKQSEDA